MEDVEVLELSSLRVGRKYGIDCLGYCPPEGPAPSYMTFQESQEWVMDHQPVDYDPQNPTGGLNEEIFDRVKRKLPRKLRKFLRLYIAVGSSFDQWHGVDAFF